MVVTGKRTDNGTYSGALLGPRSHVSRTAEGGALLEVELPGFGAEDVEIQVEGSRLTIRARRNGETEGSLLIGERRHGDREAHFVLADGLDTEHLDARMRDGILTLRIDRKPELKPRTIKVKKG
ncbi:MAG: Hsp20/alpha crystallin family protein [Alkalispirochaetaceae bacterium]